MITFSQYINDLNAFIVENFYKKQTMLIFGVIFISFVIITSFTTQNNSNDFINGLSNNDNKYGCSITSIFIYLIILIITTLLINDYYYNFLGFQVLKPFIDNNLLINKQEKEKEEEEETELDEDKKEEETKEEIDKNEVFNIADNKYTYNEARAVCSAYDARLATYSEVEDSYNKGGEWCNYGWSDKQLALFPTQQKTYDHLQTTENHKNSCGRPGVNGGFFEDSDMKFGINCYGIRPEKTDNNSKKVSANTIMNGYPLTKEEKEINEKTDELKKNIKDIIMYPFNYDNWTSN